MRAEVVHGLLRRGETCLIVATTKVGKSWLVVDLVLAVATGTPWLGTFTTVPGRVLVIDNELHGETLSDRLRRVAEARGIDPALVRDRVAVWSLRGKLKDISALGRFFRRLERGAYDLVVIDALFRALPEGVSENDNAQMAAVFNTIDAYAEHLGGSFACVHHASKGSQAEKAVTDVGAGAGSMSRAVDSHIVLRPHEQDGVFVCEAAVRSFPPLEPQCLRWTFPCWNPEGAASPDCLRRPEDKRRQAAKKAREKGDDGALLAKLDEVDVDRRGHGIRQLRSLLGWGHERMSGAVGRLLTDGTLEPVQVPYKSGNGAERDCDGVRRRTVV
jgi:hypothetical protein